MHNTMGMTISQDFHDLSDNASSLFFFHRPSQQQGLHQISTFPRPDPKEKCGWETSHARDWLYRPCNKDRAFSVFKNQVNAELVLNYCNESLEDLGKIG